MNNPVIVFCAFALAACGNEGSALTPVSHAPQSPGTTQISVIQGTGPGSPIEGQAVVVVAIVTGDFQDNDNDETRNLGGFYVQQESSDGDSATSDGVFVFDGDSPTTAIDVGDRVEVTGTVTEYYGETQIHAASVTVVGSGVIETSDINLPSSDLEAYEGMLVRFPQKLTVTSLRYLERYGEVGLSQGHRPFQFTNGNLPSTDGYTRDSDSIADRAIILDDGLRLSNPTRTAYLNAGASADYSIRAGDSITGVSGNLRYSRGSGSGGEETWRLMPTELVVFANDNPRPGVPSVGGSTRIASLNVLNFFSHIDTGAATCGPERDANCRGADSTAELSRQLAKTVSAIVHMDADIIGLVEIENDTNGSLVTIVDALNSRVGEDVYAFIDTGRIHTDAIKTGFIYDTLAVRTKGDFAILDSSVDPRFDDNRNRPALAQSFENKATGAVVTVVVNHLKSKGSSCESSGDPNTHDGQGNCNKTRTNAATALADWVNSDPTGSGDPDVLVIGDLNAYRLEDPLTALKNAGLINLLDGNPNPYSYLFDAKVGALDHALVTRSLEAQVVETIEWHINADEPPLLDYNLENDRDATLFDPMSPYRVSDHDPIIIGLDLSP